MDDWAHLSHKHEQNKYTDMYVHCETGKHIFAAPFFIFITKEKMQKNPSLVS